MTCELVTRLAKQQRSERQQQHFPRLNQISVRAFDYLLVKEAAQSQVKDRRAWRPTDRRTLSCHQCHFRLIGLAADDDDDDDDTALPNGSECNSIAEESELKNCERKRKHLMLMI